MKFKIEDREYVFDGKVTVEDGMFIHEKSGLGLRQLNGEIGNGNPFAIAAFMYLLKRRAGEAVRWQDMLKLDLNTFDMVVEKPEEQEAAKDPIDDAGQAKAATPDPTPSGRTRKGATTST